MTTALLDSELDEYSAAMDAATIAADRDACDWPELRREILRQGGIGPSRDWSADAWPGDLYRVQGKAPDLVAVDTALGTADNPPWGIADGRGAGDSEMRAYLWRSWESWQRVRERERAQVVHRAPKSAPAPAAMPAPVTRAPGTRSFADLVAELKRKHGDAVDLSGLRAEYVRAYETCERVTVERDGRTYRGTVGATRSARPRFVLLLSMDL